MNKTNLFIAAFPSKIEIEIIIAYIEGLLARDSGNDVTCVAGNTRQVKKIRRKLFFYKNVKEKLLEGVTDLKELGFNLDHLNWLYKKRCSIFKDQELLPFTNRLDISKSLLR